MRHSSIASTIIGTIKTHGLSQRRNIAARKRTGAAKGMLKKHTTALPALWRSGVTSRKSGAAEKLVTVPGITTVTAKPMIAVLATVMPSRAGQQPRNAGVASGKAQRAQRGTGYHMTATQASRIGRRAGPRARRLGVASTRTKAVTSHSQRSTIAQLV